VTSQIVQGVQAAGLLETLSNPDFTVDDICNNGTLLDKEPPSEKTRGVYIRVYRTPEDTLKVCGYS
jgi:hypothetical protein